MIDGRPPATHESSAKMSGGQRFGAAMIVVSVIALAFVSVNSRTHGRLVTLIQGAHLGVIGWSLLVFWTAVSTALIAGFKYAPHQAKRSQFHPRD